MLSTLLSSVPARALLAGLTALVIVVLSGKRFAAILRGLKVAERTDKTDSPHLAELHAGKRDTPTMGGLLMVGAMLAASALWNDLSSAQTLALDAGVAAMAAIGLYDDWIKLRRERHGISARAKMGLILAAGGCVGVALALGWDGPAPSLSLPWRAGPEIAVGPALFVAIVMLLLASATNAVNLTDGLDGLAAGAFAPVAAAFTVVALGLSAGGFLIRGRYEALPWAGEVAVFTATALGAALGFLWHNRHPARMFMGNTGSLALGGVLGLAPVLLGQELLLPVAGGLFVIEALSVILQVGSFKLRGKRIFKIAPLHHHYQFLGWPETRVTARFWLLSFILSLAAVALAAWSA
ncbi:MAG: phospho-N-acetylmuramoyl-pentapeptide-transferase [Planctomycetes bacterium]|nr:phospho-N-acetylmuramoyl-pentapeptide-transferase [Planctomycetota bacterium]